LTISTGEKNKPECGHLQDKLDTRGRGRGRGVKWFTGRKSIISFIGSCASGFETKTSHNDLIANCRENFMLKLYMSSLGYDMHLLAAQFSVDNNNNYVIKTESDKILKCDKTDGVRVA
jgi:hypothetical protein